MNYGCDSVLGTYLQNSMELPIIKGGVSTQILSLPFSRYSKRVTHSWLCSVWEKVDLFNPHVEVKEVPIKPPQEHDGWIMLMLEGRGYSEDKLIHLNCFRCYQQVVFYSDIFEFSGRSIDQRYLTNWPQDALWSSLVFPQEQPPLRYLWLWRSALEAIAPRGRPIQRLNNFTGPSHKIWTIPPPEDQFIRLEIPPTYFWEVLQKWGQTWMCDNIQWVGDDNWIAGAIRDRSCIAVTDGSYMSKLYPNAHSAAYVLECAKGKGRLWGSFPETSLNSCSYRGELVGLMVIHLILLSVNEVNTGLHGTVHIYSDCRGA
jgi:hypothetical protein